MIFTPAEYTDYFNNTGVVRLHGSPYSINFYATYPTEDARDAIIALFPKYVGAKATSLTGYDRTAEVGRQRWTLPALSIRIKLVANKSNGGVNEAGAKRGRKALEVLSANNVPVEFKNIYTNGLELDTIKEILGYTGN